MGVFENIKTGLLQAIAFEKGKRVLRSRLDQAKEDVKQGRVQPSETAVADVINEIENCDLIVSEERQEVSVTNMTGLG